MDNLFDNINLISVTYQEHQDHWLWWLFFPSALAKALKDYDTASDQSSKIVAIIQLFEIYARLWWISRWLFHIIEMIAAPTEYSIYQFIRSSKLDTSIMNKFMSQHLPNEDFSQILNILQANAWLSNQTIEHILSLKAPLACVKTLDKLAKLKLVDEVYLIKFCGADLALCTLNLLNLILDKEQWSQEIEDILLTYHPTDTNLLDVITLLIDTRQLSPDWLSTLCQLPATQFQDLSVLFEQLLRYDLLNYPEVYDRVKQGELGEMLQALDVLAQAHIASSENIQFICKRQDALIASQCLSKLLAAGCDDKQIREILNQESQVKELTDTLLSLQKVSPGHLDTLYNHPSRTAIIQLFGVLNFNEPRIVETLDDLLTHACPEVLSQAIKLATQWELINIDVVLALIKHQDIENAYIQLTCLYRDTSILDGPQTQLNVLKFLCFPHPVLFGQLLDLGLFSKKEGEQCFLKVMDHPQTKELYQIVNRLKAQAYPMDKDYLMRLIMSSRILDLDLALTILERHQLSSLEILKMVMDSYEDKIPIHHILEAMEENQFLSLATVNQLVKYRFILFGYFTTNFWKKIDFARCNQQFFQGLIEICQHARLPLVKKTEEIVRFFLNHIYDLDEQIIDQNIEMMRQAYLFTPEISQMAYHYFEHFCPSIKDKPLVEELLNTLQKLDVDKEKKKNVMLSLLKHQIMFTDPISNVCSLYLMSMIAKVVNQLPDPSDYLKQFIDKFPPLAFNKIDNQKIFEFFTCFLNSVYERLYIVKLSAYHLKDEIMGILHNNAELYRQLFPTQVTDPISILPIWESIKDEIYQKMLTTLQPFEVDKLAETVRVDSREIAYKTLFISSIELYEPASYALAPPK